MIIEGDDIICECDFWIDLWRNIKYFDRGGDGVSREMIFWCVCLIFMDDKMCKIVYIIIIKSGDIICECYFWDCFVKRYEILGLEK